MSEWQAIPFSDPARAERLWQRLQGSGLQAELFAQFAPALLNALKGTPEPDRLLLNLERWVSTLGNPLAYYRLFAESPRLMEPLLRVLGLSQYMADTILQSPELSEILLDPTLLYRKRTRTDLQRDLNRLLKPCTSHLMRLDRLRLFKQQELLRITALDLLGVATLPEVARQLSDLADVCIQSALEACDLELRSQIPMEGALPLVVIGMGKLGGRELNYSSDIDLIFIADCDAQTRFHGAREPLAYLTRLCEMVVQALSNPMRRGIVFRVDLRLRPEGRFGPIVRSLRSAWHYYEHWAEMWERQAMIKARPCAGDLRIGERFLEHLRPWVYRRHLSEDDFHAIVEQRERIEAQTKASNRWETDIKNGWGGIRDIEFAVQALQLVYGGRFPRLRTPNTLEALHRLRTARLIDPETAQALHSAYCFLRTVEHRLQLLYGHQTHTLPSDPTERALFAKRMGFDNPDAFYETLHQHRESARAFWERVARISASALASEAPPAPFSQREKGETDSPLLVGEGLGVRAKQNLDSLTLLFGTEEGATLWEGYLHQLGFRDPKRIYALLCVPAVGNQYGESPPEVRRAFQHLLPALLNACARTPDPDRTLIALEQLADALPNRAGLYQTFAESEEVLTRLAELAQSPPLWQRLLSHLEFLDMLFGEEIVAPGAKGKSAHEEALNARLQACRTERTRLANLQAYARREWLRIGARDLWGETTPLQTAQDLTALAETLLEAILPEGVYLLAFGSFGSGELGFGSDWDVAFLIPPEPHPPKGGRGDVDPLIRYSTQIQAFLQLCQQMATVSAFRPVDTRLRPEGSAGAIVRTLEGYRDYFARYAEPWERLASTRIRLINAEYPAFQEVLDAFRYGAPPTPEEQSAMRHLILRALSERVRPEERARHLKLGHGGLAVIEFIAQWGMVHHATQADAPLPVSTLGMLEWLYKRGVLARPDYELLRRAWELQYHLRNRLCLLFDHASETLPTGEAFASLAYSLGYSDPSPLEEEFQDCTEGVAGIAQRMLGIR